MKINKNKLLRYLADIAFTDFTEFAQVSTDEEGAQCLVVKDTAALKAAPKHAIASMKVGTKGIEIKPYDRLKAIEMLARFTGVFAGDDSGLERLRELFDGLDEEDEA